MFIYCKDLNDFHSISMIRWDKFIKTFFLNIIKMLKQYNGAQYETYKTVLFGTTKRDSWIRHERCLGKVVRAHQETGLSTNQRAKQEQPKRMSTGNIHAFGRFHTFHSSNDVSSTIIIWRQGVWRGIKPTTTTMTTFELTVTTTVIKPTTATAEVTAATTTTERTTVTGAARSGRSSTVVPTRKRPTTLVD